MRKYLIKFLKLILPIFWNLHSPLLRKNIQYKDIHKGETCLIFGNGASLKFYNFNLLPKYPAIGCAYSLIDNRIKNVDLRYLVIADSYGFYPVYYHALTNRIRENHAITRGRRMFIENNDKIIFTSVSSLYAKKKGFGKMVYFNHYKKNSNPYSYDLAGSFNSSKGSLDAMIGVAKYLGFKKAILLGCDYLGFPTLNGHFYSNKYPEIGKEAVEYCSDKKELLKDIEILVVTPKDVICKYFPYISYSKFTNSVEEYKENFEIIDPFYMNYLREAEADDILYL